MKNEKENPKIEYRTLGLLVKRPIPLYMWRIMGSGYVVFSHSHGMMIDDAMLKMEKTTSPLK